MITQSGVELHVEDARFATLRQTGTGEAVCRDA